MEREKFKEIKITPEEKEKEKPFDAVIVYGEGPVVEVMKGRKGTIGYRAEGRMNTYAAGSLYQEGKVRRIIVSGGKTGGEELQSEAERMAWILKERFHVPENDIILEPKAKNTIENTVFTANILDKEPAKYQDLLALTVSHHLERTKEINDLMGVKTKYISSEEVLMAKDPEKYKAILEKIAQHPDYQSRRKEQKRWARGLKEIPEYWLPQAAKVENLERFRGILKQERIKDWLKDIFDIDDIDKLSETEIKNLQQKIRDMERIMPKEEGAESKFLLSSKEVFSKICRAETEKGIAFYASDPKTRYPWIYTRDLSCFTNSFLELGDFKTAKGCCDFLLSCQLEDGRWVQRYNEKGERKEGKKQEDNTPLAIWAILRYVEQSGNFKFAEEIKDKIKKAANLIKEENKESLDKFGLVHSTTSIHEALDAKTRNPVNLGYEIWNNSVSAKALELVAKIYKDDQFKLLSEKIKEGIKKNLIKEGKFIRKITDENEPDLSPDIMTLAPAYFDLFKKEEIINGKYTFSEITQKTLKDLYLKLWDKKLGGFRRFPGYDHQEKHPDYKGVIDPLLPGPWVFYTAWVAQIHFKLGESEKGKRLIDWIFNQRREGMLPEHLVDKEIFLKFKNKEVKYHQETKKDPSQALKNLELMEKEAKKPEVKKLFYAWPLAWSHAETLKACKLANLIKEFKLNL